MNSSGAFHWGGQGNSEWYFKKNSTYNGDYSASGTTVLRIASDGNIYSAYYGDWLSNVFAGKVSTSGGSTIAGTTYFSGGESMQVYGIRGRFTNEYIHLYNKVGIGNPNGWGEGQGNTPVYGLSTYGGAVFAYGNNATSSFNGHLRIDRNWGLGDYGAEQFTIRGTYPSITLRSTQHNSKWLIHNDDTLSFYYGGTVDDNSWGRKLFIPTDGNIWMSWAGDYISNLLGAKQNASTAITTSNIGSQSVNYATTAGTATSAGSASVATSAGSVDGLTINNSGDPINPDNVTQNQIGYNTSVSLYGQSDGGLYSSAYSSSWIHQIYGDFRTGQIAIRGKNAGTWQDWRYVLDDKNIGSYAVPYGNMTSSTGLNDNKLYLRTNGDNNHYLWNAADDWEELVYYTGTGFRVKGSTGTVSAAFTDSGISIGSSGTLVRSFDAQGYLRIYGSSTNFLGIGPYNNNGWVYFENSGNGNGIYFNTPGRYAFDSVDVTPYTDAENSLGNGSYRWSQVYTSGWLRQYGAQGMYNESYGTHFYSNSAEGFVVTGSGGVVQLQFRSNHQSTIRGYVYADTSNQIGFLNNGGGWALRTNSSNNAFIHGTDLTINADNSGSSNIFMNDGDEGARQIHCNSNRIGFLNQSGSWGSWCNDDGSWATAGGLSVAGNTSWFGGYGGGSGPGLALENQNTFARFAFFGLDFYDWNHGVQMAIDGNYVYVNNYLQAGNSLRAPIFYDSNDTGYYLDPNGTSNLLQLNTSTRARWNMPRTWYDRSSRTSDENYWTGTNGWSTSDGTWAGAWKGGFSGWDIWGTGTDHPQGGGYVHAQGIVSGVHYTNSTGSDAYGWMMVGAADATANRYWLRGKWATTTSSWTEMMTSNNNPIAWNMDQYVRTSDSVSFNSTTSPTFLVNSHSDNTKGYRIHNTSGSSVSAMFVNSSNQLVIAAGAVDQINLNKKVYVNGVALGVNVTPSSTAGRIDASNDIVAYSSSDERLKHNITPIENAIDKVKSLTGVEFDWKPEYKHAHGYEGHDTGIIAQQVQEVIPSAVRTNDTGFLAVRYEKLIGLLIEANKELAARVEELEKKLG
jgi:hypothetical protein